jgi:hypothetical protein
MPAALSNLGVALYELTENEEAAKAQRTAIAAKPDFAKANLGNADRPVRTASATQVRQPLYNSAVGRWRSYEQHLGPPLEALRLR